MPIEDVLRGNDASEVDVSFRALFATLVAITPMPNHQALNSQLRQIILDRERESAGEQHSNLGGWQSSADMMTWGGPAFHTVLNLMIAVANSLTCDREGKQTKMDWKVNAWANINRAGHWNHFHTHPGCFWSGSYYVDDGGIGEDPSLGGEFEMMDPRGVAPAMYAPMLAFNVPGGLSIGASEILRPADGMLVIFPSWLCHGVRLYRGTQTRISVAFNLSL